MLLLAAETELQAVRQYPVLGLPALPAQFAQTGRFVIELVDIHTLQTTLAQRQPGAESGIAIPDPTAIFQPQQRGGELIEGWSQCFGHCTIIVQLQMWYLIIRIEIAVRFSASCRGQNKRCAKALAIKLNLT